MKLLTDEDLYMRIAEPIAPARPLIEPVPNITNWRDKDSLVQPSSIDLSVGPIYIPGRANPYGDYILETGQTAIIVTQEHLVLPSNIAAIGFPPSHVSIKGLLMTNPGHVDPGYEGPMHLTVINMGKEGFALRRGDSIVTILFFLLTSPPKADWRTRNGEPGPARAPADALAKLSSDFVNVEKRARSIARRTVAKATVFGTIAGTVVAGALTLGGLLLPGYLGQKPEIEHLKQDVARLEQSTTQGLAIEKRIEDLDRRISVLEARAPSRVSAASAAGRKK